MNQISVRIVDNQLPTPVDDDGYLVSLYYYNRPIPWIFRFLDLSTTGLFGRPQTREFVAFDGVGPRDGDAGSLHFRIKEPGLYAFGNMHTSDGGTHSGMFTLSKEGVAALYGIVETADSVPEVKK